MTNSSFILSCSGGVLELRRVCLNSVCCVREMGAATDWRVRVEVTLFRHVASPHPEDQPCVAATRRSSERSVWLLGLSCACRAVAIDVAGRLPHVSSWRTSSRSWEASSDKCLPIVVRHWQFPFICLHSTVFSCKFQKHEIVLFRTQLSFSSESCMSSATSSRSWDVWCYAMFSAVLTPAAQHSSLLCI